MTYEQAVKELFYWQYGREGSWFTARLFELASKADSTNLQRLMRGFPNEIAALEAWRKTPDAKEFFLRYGHTIEIAKKVDTASDDLDFDGERGLLSNHKRALSSTET